jgi:group I intron endonuclease
MCKKRVDGVYLIKNMVTLNIRVGSCKDVKKRWSNYKSRLKSGNGNKLMQEDYNNYGIESFDFVILEECNVKDLFKREQYWLEEYADCCMYNKNKVVNTKKRIRTGREAKNYKTKRSLVTSGENNGHCTVLNELKASEILWLKNNTDMKQIEIAAMYGCKPTMVSRIGNDRWTNVEEIKPLFYVEIKKEIVSTGILAISDENINISL